MAASIEAAAEVALPETPPTGAATQEIMQKLNELAQQNQAMNALVGLVTQLQTIMQNTSKEEKQKGTLIQQKGLEYVPKYNGIYEDFDQWRDSLFGFLGVGEWVCEMLEWAQKQTEQITESMVEEYGEVASKPAVKISKQLHTVLQAKTEKNPRSLTDNVEQNNGVRAWQRISEIYGRIHPQARRRLLEMLL